MLSLNNLNIFSLLSPCRLILILAIAKVNRQFISEPQLTLKQHSLNCKGALIHRFFSIVNTRVVHDLSWAESKNAELEWGRSTVSYIWIFICTSVSTPNPQLVQGSTVNKFHYLCSSSLNELVGTGIKGQTTILSGAKQVTEMGN